jgi:hypothetical protein
LLAKTQESVMHRKFLGRSSLIILGGLSLLATAAVAGSGVGGIFNLGQVNTVDARTQLDGTTSTQQLYVVNRSTTPSSIAVFGLANKGAGLYGVSTGLTGARGSATGVSGVNYGVVGTTASPDGFAGLFHNRSGSTNPAKGTGIRGLAAIGSGSEISPGYFRAGGEFIGPNGAIGAASRSGGYGLLGIQGPGSYAIYAAGRVRIFGNLSVSGSVSKGSGSFKIDHPLDPANKYLSHSFVESPDMMNIYNGNVVTDVAGEAVVELPDYFEALNRDPRYQLTVIGSPATAYISRKVTGNRFAIRTSEPGVEVSWQVTGIRQDAFAQAHPVVVEEEKTLAERGRYLYPEEYGKPAELAIGAEQGLQQHAAVRAAGPEAGANDPAQSD